MGAAVKLEFQETPEDTKPRGTVKGHEFFNLDNKLMGYVKGEEIYTSSHFKVAYTKTGNVYNTGNKKMISLTDAKKIMNCQYDGVTLAAYWFFFKPK